IYAVLYSNIYRENYQEFLKIDFPRIPFTKNLELFSSLSILGEQLVNLHLLKSSLLNNPVAKFDGTGESKVEKIEYKEGRIYINPIQYFHPVTENIYNYYIGGYQVLNKWLKDRKGRILSSEEIKHYCHIITSLHWTLDIQERIDKLYLQVEKNI
ncbi:MAG: type ISP restriction/modification enzyme, partial [bacterium]|nr:type ISP restriction/modification enzyme [bacterium]